jgi:ABC-2 type transport system permease protein
MNTLYVLVRVLRQFRRDRRTLALVLVVPVLIMSIYYLLFMEDLQTGLRIGVYFRGEATPFVSSMAEAFKEIAAIRFTALADGDLARATDRLDLDAAIAFPETLQTDLIRSKKVSYDLLLEGTKLQARAIVENVVRAATLGALKKRLPVLVPEVAFDPAVSYRHLSGSYRTIDVLAPSFIAFFLYFISFLLTCVAFLRERSTGTLERLFVTPIRSVELLLGYLLAFFVLSTVQSVLLLVYSTYVLGIKTAVGIAVAFVPITVTVLLGVTMGIFFSTLARNEFQVIQFIPIVIIPQGLLCGLLFEVEAMPPLLRSLSRAMPLTYTTDILKNVLLRARPLGTMWQDFLTLAGFLFLFFLLSLVVVRKVR